MLWGASRVGLALGRRADRLDVRDAPRSPTHPKFGVIESAMLALLGLMIGFSFSSAMDRYARRQDLLVQEANAIGTAFLRADLVPEPQRQTLRAAWRQYADVRLELFRTLSPDQAPALMARLRELQSTIWSTAVEGVRTTQMPDLNSPVLDPINNAIDLLEQRSISIERHIPLLVLVVLCASAMGSVGAVYFGLGDADRRVRGYAAVLTTLIGASLWMTFDMDHPRVGLIRASGTPLINLRDSLQRSAP